jgi:uncharacterized protein
MRPEWWSALEGGALIGLSAALLLFANGRIAGISGIVGGALRPRPHDFGWRAAFVLGLVLGGLLLFRLLPASFDMAGVPTLPVIAAAGLLVGFGTRLGSGCTSGHGICGIGRGSPRSVLATMTFMLTGVITVYIARHIL